MQRPVRAQALHYLVEDQDRSSILYYVMARDESAVVDLRFCMQSILRSCRRSKAATRVGRHVLMIPRPVAHAALGISKKRMSFQKAHSLVRKHKHKHKNKTAADQEAVYQHCEESETRVGDQGCLCLTVLSRGSPGRIDLEAARCRPHSDERCLS